MFKIVKWEVRHECQVANKAFCSNTNKLCLYKGEMWTSYFNLNTFRQ